MKGEGVREGGDMQQGDLHACTKHAVIVAKQWQAIISIVSYHYYYYWYLHIYAYRAI